MDYSRVVDFISLEEARKLNWVRGPLKNDVDVVCLAGFMPLEYKSFWQGENTNNFFKSKGFKIVEGDGLPTTGAAVFCLQKL